MSNTKAPWFKHITCGSDTCVVVFSSFATRDYGPEAFSFTENFSKFPGACDILFVKDVKNQWYNKNIEGVGKTVDETTEWLRETLKPYKTTRFFGSSMGAYAGLLFGGRLKADHIIAMSPQTFLRAPYPRYSPRIHSGEYIDIQNEDLSGAKRIDIVIGQEDLFDVFQLCTLVNNANLAPRLIPKCYHITPHYLDQQGRFDALVGAVADGSAGDLLDEWDTEYKEQGYAHRHLKDPAFVAALNAYIVARYGGSAVNAMEALTRLIPENGEWAGALFAMGMAKYDAGALVDAIDLLQQTRRIAPAIYDAHRPLARMLAGLKRFHQAAEVAREGARMNSDSNRTLPAEIADIKAAFEVKAPLVGGDASAAALLTPAEGHAAA